MFFFTFINFHFKHRLTGPAYVAMEISKNGSAARKWSQISTERYFEPNTDVRSKHTQSDFSMKHIENKGCGNIEEKLFPAGMVADLQKNIEGSSVRSYIGRLYNQ